MEKELKKLGFKKNWLSDKSGYWFTKNIKYKGISLRIYVETDNRRLVLCSRVLNEYYVNVGLYEPIQKFRYSLNNIKNIIKRYK